jgi:hypothetical protein
VGAITTFFRHSLSQKGKARWLDWRKNTTSCVKFYSVIIECGCFQLAPTSLDAPSSLYLLQWKYLSRLLQPIRAIVSYWHPFWRTLARSLPGAATRIRPPPPPGASTWGYVTLPPPVIGSPLDATKWIRMPPSPGTSTWGYVTLGTLGPVCCPHLPPEMAAFPGGAPDSVGSLVKTRWP